MRRNVTNFPGIAPGLFKGWSENMKENIHKIGKYLSMRVFVTGENLEKLKEIQSFLNSQNDVISGDVEPWTKAAIYELLFNSAIEEFEIKTKE